MAIRVPSRTRQRAYGYVKPAAAAPIVPPACPVLGEPTNAEVVDETDSVTLSWGAIDGADSYAIFLWESSGDQPAEPTHETSALTLEVTGLTADTTYSWIVCAVEDGLLSVGCGARTFTTAEELPEVPACPTLLSPNYGDAFNVDQPVTLTWSAVANADSYNVYSEIDYEGNYPFISAPTTLVGNTAATEWVINPQLVPATTYTWLIKAVNAGGEGPSCDWRFFFTGSLPPGVECLSFVEGFSADPKSVRQNLDVTGYGGNADIWFSSYDFPSEWSQGEVGHAVQTFGAWGATTAATGCQATMARPLCVGEFLGDPGGMPASGSSYTLAFPALTASSDFVFSQIIGFEGPENPTDVMTLRITIDGSEVASEVFDWTGPFAHLDMFPSNAPPEAQVAVYWRVFFIWIEWSNGESAPDSVNIEPITITTVKDQYEP